MKIEMHTVTGEIAELIHKDSRRAATMFKPLPAPPELKASTFVIVLINGQQMRVTVADVVEGSDGG